MGQFMLELIGMARIWDFILTDTESHWRGLTYEEARTHCWEEGRGTRMEAG